MNTEILNKYIELINKGYCSDCNELNCIGNFPQKDIAESIKFILKENRELKNQQKEFIEYLENEIQKQKDYGASFGLFIDRDISEHISEKIETCQDFLSKYKEIVGGKNEN